MRSLSQRVCLSSVVLFSAITGGSAAAELPSEALDAYVKAYTRMGKAAALIFSHDKTRADARNNMISTWVDAQCKMLSAKAAWITAMAEAQATRAKTLQTLQQVRGLALDNDLKTAKTFYEKRKLHDADPGLDTRKRPTQEDVIRYSKTSAPQRPASFQLEPVRGRIHWPAVFHQEEFADCRIRLECLFAQRKAGTSAPASGVCHQVQEATAEMHEQLRAKIRRMSPAEYVAARNFLESLAYEARFPARIEGVASN